MTRSQQQQLVVQIYAKRYAQLWLEYDRETQELGGPSIELRRVLSHRVEDLERARLYDLAREYPLCLNPKLNLRPEIIETKWGVLFA